MIRAIMMRSMLLTLAVLATAPAWAVTLDIDYTYDTGNFFGSGNPQGAAAGLQARASLEAAADSYSDILDDTFSSIQTPPVYHSQVFDGTVTWSWTMSFQNPTSGTTVNLVNQLVAADEYRIYVGARNLPSDTLGFGGPGGYSWSSTPTGGFTSAEIVEIEQITDDFSAAVEDRGEPSGFARWGGAVTFDNVGTTWHYDHTTPPTGGTNDFFSVAIHELAHTLGFGASTSWTSLVSGSYFIGAASTTEHGGAVPLDVATNKAHWANGTMSTVLGSAMPQETLMDPSLTVGTRKRLTNLDAAGLTDIGWTVDAPPSLEGDYNGNGVVDAADYTVWRDGLGTIFTPADYTVWKANFGNTLGSGTLTPASVPEPLSIVLFLPACLGAVALRRR
jgi:hypothetical protein